MALLEMLAVVVILVVRAAAEQQYKLQEVLVTLQQLLLVKVIPVVPVEAAGLLVVLQVEAVALERQAVELLVAMVFNGLTDLIMLVAAVAVVLLIQVCRVELGDLVEELLQLVMVKTDLMELQILVVAAQGRVVLALGRAEQVDPE